MIVTFRPLLANKLITGFHNNCFGGCLLLEGQRVSSTSPLSLTQHTLGHPPASHEARGLVAG